MAKWSLKRIICCVLLSPLFVVWAVLLAPFVLLAVLCSTLRWMMLTVEGQEDIDFWGW